jgi:hypothetical protein
MRRFKIRIFSNGRDGLNNCNTFAVSRYQDVSWHSTLATWSKFNYITFLMRPRSVMPLLPFYECWMILRKSIVFLSWENVVMHLYENGQSLVWNYTSRSSVFTITQVNLQRAGVNNFEDILLVWFYDDVTIHQEWKTSIPSGSWLIALVKFPTYHHQVIGDTFQVFLILPTMVQEEWKSKPFNLRVVGGLVHLSSDKLTNVGQLSM